MGTARIAAAFAASRARGEVALIPYVPAGFPSLATSAAIVAALAAAGADLIEIGIPFSDPLADGATIQRATQIALKGGTTFDRCLDLVRTLRPQVAAPLIFMGYYNPLHYRGVDRAIADCAAAGVDGLIIPDLPPEEAGDLLAAARRHDLALIFLVSPVSSDARLARVGALGSGFLYCVSLTGVTGARSELSQTLPEYVARVRRHTDLPLAIGFGLSTAAHIAAVGRLADAAVVASALIDRVSAAPGQEAAVAAAYLHELRGRPASIPA
ncbi:MAG TPA: tryptophan synthase subunit alpha [Chloroflexia bacterium]|nr:tryptophan synthase subunit alpha [Chloroflexia bacterium]